MSDRSDRSDWFDGDVIPEGLWQNALRRAINGKKGQALLRELREALLAVPGHRLITGQWCKDGEVCALGALAANREVERTGKTWADVVSGLAELSEYTTTITGSTEEAVSYLGMQWTLGWTVAIENDNSWITSDEARWQQMYRWVCEQLDENPDLTLIAWR